MEYPDAVAALNHLNVVRALVAPFAAAPPPVFLDPREPAGQFVIADTIVLPGERVALVRVRLATPLLRQVEILFSTVNGTAKAGTASWAHYEAVKTRLVYRPGELEKIVPVPIRKDLGTLTFVASVSHTQNYPALPDAKGVVRQATSREAIQPLPQPTFAPPEARAGRQLIYREDFLGPLTWSTKAGLHQSVNKELALYTDAAAYPGFDPHPIEMVDGVRRRILRMIRMDVELKKPGGASLKLPYRAPMLDSSTSPYQCRDGDYVELDVAIAKDTGGIPAFWLVAGNPYAEDDIFEFGLTGSGGAMACSAHYPDEDGYVVPENCVVDFRPDGRMHTYGYERGPVWCITTVDGVEVHRRRNLFPGRTLPVKINNTAGGIGPDPKWRIGQTEDMVLGEFRAYRG